MENNLLQIAFFTHIAILTTIYCFGIFAMKNAENVQKPALGFIVNNYVSHYENLLSKTKRCTMNLCPLASNFIARVFQLYNNTNPDYIQNLFGKNRRSQRRSIDLIISFL